LALSLTGQVTSDKHDEGWQWNSFYSDLIKAISKWLKENNQCMFS
jgi:hypothetical protein